jgi:hypothetical protein
MLKSLACAGLVAGGLTGAALAAEPLPQPTGPVVLGDEQLDRVAAGNSWSSLPVQAFFFSHGILAANSGGLPELAQKAIILLHKPFLNGNT